MKRLWQTCVVVVLIVVAATAQSTTTRSVYAIRGAKIYPVSGEVISNGTIVIRNSLIATVGTNVQIPPEATVIEGMGLVVYPGLIDSFTDAGLPPTPAALAAAAQQQGQQQQAQQQPTPKNTQEALFQTPLGLNADRVLAQQVRPTGKDVETYRNLGITSALTVSRDGVLTGQSVLINTGDSNIVVKTPVALHINPASVVGGYPSTLMGALAVLRQAFWDADWYKQSWDRFNRNPRGIERPPYDRVLDSMVPVLQGQLPSIIHADWSAQIKRAVALAEELKLKPIIAGGYEAGSLAAMLKSKDIPVLISVNYARQKPRAGATGAAEFDEEETKEFLSNAALLQKAGVRFALQSGFAERPQLFFDNIRKAMDNGLTRDQALRATTLSPAEILGVGNALGSLEPGKSRMSSSLPANRSLAIRESEWSSWMENSSGLRRTKHREIPQRIVAKATARLQRKLQQRHRRNLL